MRALFSVQILFFIVLALQFGATHFPVYQPHTPFFINDKLLHGVAYFVLMILFRASWPHITFVPALAVCAVYGLVDELTQIFAVGRTPEILDWCADLAGATVGYVSYGLWYRTSRRLGRFGKGQDSRNSQDSSEY